MEPDLLKFRFRVLAYKNTSSLHHSIGKLLSIHYIHLKRWF